MCTSKILEGNVLRKICVYLMSFKVICYKASKEAAHGPFVCAMYSYIQNLDIRMPNYDYTKIGHEILIDCYIYIFGKKMYSHIQGS